MPGDGAVEVVVGRAEAEQVEERDRPRAHRRDVAEDPADAGRRALERLDRRRVVVALDLERDRLALAEVEHARVLARPLQHALARRRQPAAGAAPSACTRSARDQRSEKTASSKWFGSRSEQVADALQLPVGQAEGPVEEAAGRASPEDVQSSRGNPTGRRYVVQRDDPAPARRCCSPSRRSGDRRSCSSRSASRSSSRRRSSPGGSCSRRSRSLVIVAAAHAAAARRSGRSAAHLGAFLFVALLNSVVPFWLLAWGETRIDSGLAALLQACAPLFTALLATFFFVRSERVDGRPARSASLVGFGGVALLVGAVAERQRARRARGRRSPASATRPRRSPAGATSRGCPRRRSPSARRALAAVIVASVRPRPAAVERAGLEGDRLRRFRSASSGSASPTSSTSR